MRFAWRGRRRFTLEVDTLRVPPRERLLLTGPSGSGKSTLLSLVAGTVVPESGEVRLAGTDIARLPARARDRFRAEHIGIVFQMFNLLPYGTVLDNVVLPLSFAPARRARAERSGGIRDEARRLLRSLELEEALIDGTPASSLSVGQQQRVAAARALIGEPEIVLADEPTSALDAGRREAFLDVLFNQVEAAGAALIMVSHDESLSSAFDRVARLGDVARTTEAASS